MKRDFDVILYGATGFTGRQTADYFARNAPDGLRWAIAGRDPKKLEALAGGLDRAPDGVIVANGLDRDAVSAMCARGRVLLTTAGPFSRFGDLVVDACVFHRTDYVDITGETPWVRRLIDRHHRPAPGRTPDWRDHLRAVLPVLDRQRRLPLDWVLAK